jgi:excisionase family DNA binding protein
MAETWITTKQAAELSGYHPVHLLRLVRAGSIKARKFGIVWQVDRASLQAYIRAAEKSGDRRRGGGKKRS